MVFVPGKPGHNGVMFAGKCTILSYRGSPEKVKRKKCKYDPSVPKHSISFVTFNCFKYAMVFVPGKPFQPCLMIAGEA
jgi:hypothetical protein